MEILNVSAFAFRFGSWMEVSDSIILVESPLNALMRDQSIKLDSMQVPSVVFSSGDSSDFSALETNDLISANIESFMGTQRSILEDFGRFWTVFKSGKR